MRGTFWTAKRTVTLSPLLNTVPAGSTVIDVIAEGAELLDDEEEDDEELLDEVLSDESEDAEDELDELLAELTITV